MPTDPQLEGCFHLLPELNLEGLCSPSSSSYSLFGIYKWVVEMEFNVFLKDSVAHVKKMEEKGTLASDHKMRNHCWVITPDETFIVIFFFFFCFSFLFLVFLSSFLSLLLIFFLLLPSG